MSTPRSPRARRLAVLTALCAATALLAACGGGGGGGSSSTDDGATGGSAAPPVPPPSGAPANTPTTTLDATRLAHQASFGPTEALVADIRARGASNWLAAQMTTASSRYTRGGNGDVHQWTGSGNYCDGRSTNCWRDSFSSQPLLWDFYRNAVGGADQLRQRVAFALQKIVVVSNLEVEGTYGMRYYYNTLLDNAFGNYRQVLKKVALSPLMGDYLNNANNDKAAPNENFARELLELHTLGVGEYDETDVREVARCFTGWTMRPREDEQFGDFVFDAAEHDDGAKSVLGHSLPPHGGERDGHIVLDLVARHPATARRVALKMCRAFVAEEPPARVVDAVACAFSDSDGDGRATLRAVLRPESFAVDVDSRASETNERDHVATARAKY
ncbi:MAG: DUF1800 domain-containing protein, partial [Methylibium sp.]|nr:DUF1800 domain-containing protein [Methylibium sp.]